MLSLISIVGIISCIFYCILMLLIPFCIFGIFDFLPGNNRLKYQTRDRRRFVAYTIIAFVLLCILFIPLIARTGVHGLPLTILAILPIFITMISFPIVFRSLYYRWKYHREVPNVFFVILMVTLLTIGVLISTTPYYIITQVRRDQLEQPSPAVPPPLERATPPWLRTVAPVSNIP